MKSFAFKKNIVNGFFMKKNYVIKMNFKYYKSLTTNYDNVY